MYGILKIHGEANYLIVNLWVNVNEKDLFLIKTSWSFFCFLGCFACFCPCCMGCKLAKRLGESSAIGCCPCTLQYLRTKLRTARRIEVCQEIFLKRKRKS